MIGVLIQHDNFGVGRILGEEVGRVHLLFFETGQRLTLTSKQSLRRWSLPLNSIAATIEGGCRVIGRSPANDWSKLTSYDIEYQTGHRATLTEDKIQPTASAHNATDAVSALQLLQPDTLRAFRAREWFSEAHNSTLRSGLGLTALVGSRIDLRPHQAYVAGVVILDWNRRYALADEVGLGKTIEAGIILHQILAEKPDARILIVAPGALVQQWFAELYSKFVGHVFSLPQLARTRSQNHASDRLIVSYAAMVQYSDPEEDWDLVVIDEVHNLIESPPLYRSALALAKRTKSLLLLSALPAQHREEEFLSLLALLSPREFGIPNAKTRNHFRDLYERQRRIGVKLAWAQRKLPEVLSGERPRESVIANIAEMVAWPLFAEDARLKELMAALSQPTSDFESSLLALLHHIADHYRVSRRILRNRRARLIQAGELIAAERRLVRLSYSAGELETEARTLAKHLLDAPDSAPIAAFRQGAADLMQAMADPDTLVSALRLIERASKGTKTPFEAIVQSGYARWDAEFQASWAALKTKDGDAITFALTAAERWQRSDEATRRMDALIAHLRELNRSRPTAKVLIFAGFPGLAQKVFDRLVRVFRPSAVANFIWSMSDSRKEEQVRRVSRDPGTWMMVSDESGGEGRNFQQFFEVVHYDLPWHVARVEQRIGRLDRIGRREKEVPNAVLFAEFTEDHGVLDCLDQGLGIFRQSASGLEFALRGFEVRILGTAYLSGYEGMKSLIGELVSAVQVERAEDEGVELSDEASFERTVAADFRAAQSSPSRDRALQGAFIDYFKALATPQSAHFASDHEFPDGLITFRADDLKDDPRLRVAELKGDQTGTFFRAIAQERPDLQFFAPGNPFYDHIASNLTTALRGATYAVSCVADGAPWSGFEIVFRVEPPPVTAVDEEVFAHQFSRIFTIRHERIWVADDGQVTPDAAAYRRLRQSLGSDGQGRTWQNLTNDRAQVLESYYQADGWERVVSRAVEAGRVAARAKYEESLAPKIAREKVRLEDYARELGRQTSTRAEQDRLKRYLALLPKWDLRIDAIGFIAINRNMGPRS